MQCLRNLTTRRLKEVMCNTIKSLVGSKLYAYSKASKYAMDTLSTGQDSVVQSMEIRHPTPNDYSPIQQAQCYVSSDNVHCTFVVTFQYKAFKGTRAYWFTQRVD